MFRESTLLRRACPLAAVVLLACGGGDTGNQTDTSSPDSEDTTVVGDTTDVVDTSDTGTETSVPTDTVEDTTPEVEDDTTAEVADDTTADDTTAEVADDTTAEVSDDTTSEVTEDTTSDTETTVSCPDTNRPDGCACENDVDCGSGLCASGPVGDYCASPCTSTTSCTGGATCVIGAGQTEGVCLVEIDLLCAPCKGDSDCRRAGGDATCVALGTEGSFCAVSCDEENPCFDGYTCTAGACLPTSGMCECSELASAIGASTECSTTNTFGTCTGERICGLNGTLSPCNAGAASAEICDGLDNDCNTATSETGSLCDDGNACTTDLCGGVNGCQQVPTSGGSCNDGDSCTGPDICTNGVCGGVDTCPCQPETVLTDCATPPPGMNLGCLTPTCSNNACVYTPKAGSCNDGSACTTGDTCSAGVCGGTTLDCDDDAACTTDTCNVATGCVNTPFTGVCEDNDPCTVGDTCATGECVGTTLDCSGLDGPCHQGVCDGNGGCFAQSLLCGVSAVRLHTPSAAFQRRGTGATWFVGSVGHGGPVGVGSTSARKVQFGFHPGMHR